MDLVLANSPGASELFLNDGAGTFSQSSTFMGEKSVENRSSFAVAFGDFDGDGNLDLVIGKHDYANELWMNDGSGTFSEGGTDLPGGIAFTNAVAVGDTNNDGYPDIVLGNGCKPQQYGASDDSCSHSQSMLLLNDGSGGFSSWYGLYVGPYGRAQAVALGDMDGGATASNPSRHLSPRLTAIPAALRQMETLISSWETSESTCCSAMMVV